MLTQEQSIKEDRTITREKYSELKLEAQFLQVSPGYLIATPGNRTTTAYSNNAGITITPLIGSNGSFFVARHTAYNSLDATSYKLTLPTSLGNLSIPQICGSLTLNGRDSKVHVVDYPVSNYTILYSTAEIFTWKKFEDRTVLIVYGGPGERHELAVKDAASGKLLEGSNVILKPSNGSLIAHWRTSTEKRIIQIDDLYIYILGKKTTFQSERTVEANIA